MMWEEQNILLTRDQQGNELLRSRFEQLGAHVFEFASWEAQISSLDADARDALVDLSHYDWVVATSPRVILFLKEQVGKLKIPTDSWGQVKWIVMGNRSQSLLREHFGICALMPHGNSMASLCRMTSFSDSQNLKVLLLQPEDGRHEFQQQYSKVHDVTRVHLYKKIKNEMSVSFKEKLMTNPLQWIVFMSPSSVNFFSDALSEMQIKNLVQKTKCVSIGPTTTASLIDRGWPSPVQAKNPTVEALIEAMSS